MKRQEKLEKNRQLAPSASGRHSWLTGLLKCGSCGYVVKIVRDSSTKKRYLVCSGRTNMAVCSETFHIDLTELELAMSDRLREVLAQCPDEEVCPGEDDGAREVGQINVRIERLVSALAESGAVSAGYINVQIERLHRQRDLLLKDMQANTRKENQRLRIDFDRASFEEKKIIAREFIEKITLKDDTADVIWNI